MQKLEFFEEFKRVQENGDDVSLFELTYSAKEKFHYENSRATQPFQELFEIKRNYWMKLTIQNLEERG